MVRNGTLAMETAFYDEHSYPLGANVNQLKRSLTLDLNPAKYQMKRAKYGTAMSGPPVLSSPDLNMLKLASPELERLIIQNGLVSGVTPTPSAQILFSNEPTEEQELYVRGFVDALNELHHSDSSQGGLQPVELSASGIPSVGATYTNLDRAVDCVYPPYESPLVKDEPQTVPSISSSPPLSPINMECQEKIKLERKRQRNRVAASKCRRRKLERISKLEDKVKLLKGENTDLNAVMLKLKEHVCFLKEQVMEHVNSGCQMMNSNF